MDYILRKKNQEEMDIRIEDQANGGKIVRSPDQQLPYRIVSPRVDDVERTIDNGNIEEAVSDLREGGLLNYDVRRSAWHLDKGKPSKNSNHGFWIFVSQEARALMGRIEYNRGNVEAALRLFDGIDVAAIAPKLKLSITGNLKTQSNSTHAVVLLLEAILLKSKSLAHLGKFMGT